MDRWGRCFGRYIFFPGPSLATPCFWLLQEQLPSARSCTMLSLLCIRPQVTGDSCLSVETAETVSPRDSFLSQVVFPRHLITVMGISVNRFALCLGSGWRTSGDYLSLSLTNLASSQPPKYLSQPYTSPCLSHQNPSGRGKLFTHSLLSYCPKFISRLQF